MLSNLKVDNASSNFLSTKTTVQARNKDVLDFNKYLHSNNNIDENSVVFNKKELY